MKLRAARGRGKNKGISIFLVLIVSFILPWSAAYSNYDVLIEADFLFHGQKFESGDMDDLLVDKQKIFVPSGYDLAQHVGTGLFEQFFDPFLPLSVYGQKATVLRC